jgi:hypothetical protein
MSRTKKQVRDYDAICRFVSYRKNAGAGRVYFEWKFIMANYKQLWIYNCKLLGRLLFRERREWIWWYKLKTKRRIYIICWLKTVWLCRYLHQMALQVQNLSSMQCYCTPQLQADVKMFHSLLILYEMLRKLQPKCIFLHVLCQMKQCIVSVS